MLTPETLKALDDALSAVVAQAGEDPEYAELVDALTAAQNALPEGEAKEVRWMKRTRMGLGTPRPR